MKANTKNENGLGDTAELNNNATTYIPTARDLQDIRDEEAWAIEMKAIDARLEALYDAYLAADKQADPAGYCAAKDALARALEDGLRGVEDTILYFGLSPVWHDDVACSGPLSYRLEKGIAGWDLLIQKNEVISDDYIIAMIDDEMTQAAARGWAEEVIRTSEKESRPVEEEPETIVVDGIERIPYLIVPGKFVVIFEDPTWALAEKVDTETEKGIWVPIARYEESSATTILPLVKNWAENEILDLFGGEPEATPANCDHDDRALADEDAGEALREALYGEECHEEESEGGSVCVGVDGAGRPVFED